MDKNVFGQPLIPCSTDPMTGYYRDGCCNTGDDDKGVHTVCVVLTEEFLEFSKSCGNDLTSPIPWAGFDGLKAGDQWCLCAGRWVEALRNGKAPKVILEATNEKTLEFVDMDTLINYAVRKTEH